MPIQGSDDGLKAGTVIGIKTKEGNYVKLLIDKYLPLKHGDKTLDESYHLSVTVQVYEDKKGEIDKDFF